MRIIAHRPDKHSVEEYDKKEQQARDDHSLDQGEPIVFLEVGQGDASDFTGGAVRGRRAGGAPPHPALHERRGSQRHRGPAHPPARPGRSRIPHAYFGWTEGNPVTYVLKYLALGEGDTAPVTREVLRKSIANPLDRPRIHVG